MIHLIGEAIAWFSESIPAHGQCQIHALFFPHLLVRSCMFDGHMPNSNRYCCKYSTPKLLQKVRNLETTVEGTNDSYIYNILWQLQIFVYSPTYLGWCPPTRLYVSLTLKLPTNVTWFIFISTICRISPHEKKGGSSKNFWNTSKYRNRRKFKSQTSDKMDGWKSRGGKNQRREEKKKEDQRRERVRRKKMQVCEKV